MSSILLWRAKGQVYSAGRKRQPFHQSLSFWLEILSAIALSLLLANPIGCEQSGVHHILIIDSSASMLKSPLWKEKAWLSQVQKLGSTDRFTVIRAGKSATILAGPKASPSETLIALKELHPSSPNGNINDAISLGNNLSHGKMIIFTDHPPTIPLSENLEWIAKGVSKPNIGIIKATRKQNEVKLGIWNASQNPAKTTLLVEYGEKQEKQEYEFKPQETQYINISLPQRTNQLTLKLLPKQEDGLETDNQVILYPEEPRTLKIAVDMKLSTAQTLGLHSNSGDAPLFSLADNLQPATPLKADILFTDRNLGGSADTWRVSILPKKGKSTLAHNDIFINQSHPLLYNVNLKNVYWSYSLDRKLSGLPLIETGDHVLLSEEITGEGLRKILHLNLIPQTSSLHKNPAWPILLSSILEKRRSHLPGLIASNLQSDQFISIHKASKEPWKMKTPSKEVDLGIPKNNIQSFADELGIYTLSNATKTYSVAINLLSREETNRLVQGDFLQRSEKEETLFSQNNSLILSLLLLLLLSLLTWNWRIT